MKVVINTKYGGFSLSNEAIKYLHKKGSPLVKVETERAYYGADEPMNPSYERRYDARDGYEAPYYGGVLFKDGFAIVDSSDDSENRSHPDLVEVVELLGEKANGSWAKLKVVEIPDGVEYEIGEYDGWEHVAEAHRTWG